MGHRVPLLEGCGVPFPKMRADPGPGSEHALLGKTVARLQSCGGGHRGGGGVYQGPDGHMSPQALGALILGADTRK